MNYRLVFRMLGMVLALEAAFLLLPLLVSVIYGEDCVVPIAFTILLLAAVSFALLRIKRFNKMMFAREGFLIVSFSWVLLSLFGALPFWLSGEIPSYIDAVFETVSGFTTTGASILTDVEAMPNGLLFWRSFTHWIGGMGVLVFVLAFLPSTNERSMHMLRAEVPGPSVGKLVPKIKSTAKLLYLIYLGMTLLEVILLLLGGMPLFDSLITAFGTAGTGGFSNRNASIGAYNSAYLEGVVTVFMLLFGINFSMYFLLLTRNLKQALKQEEIWWYLGISGGAMLLITLNILPQTGSFAQSFREASFQVSSIITTTGYATADYNMWPVFSKVILFLLMILGACGGSTGGGIKVSRFVILVKGVKNDIVKMIHPRSMRTIRLDGKTVDESVSRQVNLFFISYIFIIFLMTLLVSLDGFDFESTLSSVVACMGNIGPGLGMVGPTGNFSQFSGFSKLLLSMTMLLGRLEIYPLLLAMVPGLTARYKGES